MDNELFDVAVKAILETAMKSYYEGYKQCEEDYQTRSNPKDVNVSWEMSETKAACDKMIQALTR